MKMSNKFFEKNEGFTLVEIAIVLAIIGLLLAMIIPPLGAQRDIRDRNETQGILNNAKEALIGYALVNRFLPCPDTDAIPDGIENRRSDGTGTCVDDEGILPWNTLGIKNTDSWNNYFGYRADATFSNSVTLFTIDDANNASGIVINGESGALVSANSRPAAIVISDGSNGFGAINTIQATPTNKQPAPPATALDETENTNGNVTFVSHVPTQSGSVNEFDDLLVWISPKILINRMVIVGRLP
jgi:prepilin-type N-terminal cleavage/methylation domain-containing protein